MNKNVFIAASLFITAAVAGTTVLINGADDTNNSDTLASSGASSLEQNNTVPAFLESSFPNTDFSKTSVDLESILSGGPGRDGIPALTNPAFETVEASSIDDEVQAIVIEREQETKVYPYSILVWHEIVNDQVDGIPVAVTFCPLCGSALVFNRTTSVGVTDFGVSGGLLQSNMVMYDQNTESLWQQALGEAIVGQLTGEELQLESFQLLTMAEVRVEHPNARVLSTDTGFSRNYTRDPYIGYEQTPDLYFPVSATDERYEAKTIFVAWKQGGLPVATPWLDLQQGEQVLEQGGVTALVEKNGSELQITNTKTGEVIPHYFEMWFSWSVQHQQSGFVWNP